MTYQEKIDWLFVQFPSYQKVGGRAYKPGMDTMLAFDAELGHPHRAYPTVHIAGTNGKGSTSHMIAAGLAASGKRVGLYTSPHLVDFRERMRIVTADGYQLISCDKVESFLDRWKPFFEKEKPSFFEITTAMAFDWFASMKVDVAVIETGLGGRLDSTNIITPVLSVITNIGLEHCEHLGYTLPEVAYEKAGIIKPGVPAVVGEVLPETEPVFVNKAAECGSELVFAQRAPRFLQIGVDDLDLKGDYQVRNLATVSASASMLRADRISFEKGMRHAASLTGLRGRWETIREAGEGCAKIICDTGHNAHGLRWVAEQVDRVSCDYGKVVFIFGAVKDKDLHAIAPLLPRNVKYIFTQPSCDRAMPFADLANLMSDHGISGLTAPTVEEALSLAEKETSRKDLIFVGGSNYVVAELIRRGR